MIFVARAFQPEICPAGSLVSGVFFTTEGTEVEWLCGVGGCLVSREAAKELRGGCWGGCVRVVLPPHPRPLSPVGGEGCHGWFRASDEGRFSLPRMNTDFHGWNARGCV